MEQETQEFTEQLIFNTFAVTPPTYVGGYRLGKDKNYTRWFNLAYKPSWLHRQCVRIFLGWYWEDKKEN